MKAGIDFGSSLIKVVYDDMRLSSGNMQVPEIVSKMKQDSVSEVLAVGIGSTTGFEDFELKRLEGDPIQNEAKLQAEAVRKMVDIDTFLLVSIGTGTSYTKVSQDKIEKLPIGNSLGGGFIYGLGKVLGANFEEIAQNKGKPLDLCIQDLLPEKKGTFEGGLVIAHFGTATKESSKEDAIASTITTVGVGIIQDLLYIESPVDIVFIGTCVTKIPALKKILADYCPAIGKIAHFPENGEYALAIGARDCLS